MNNKLYKMIVFTLAWLLLLSACGKKQEAAETLQTETAQTESTLVSTEPTVEDDKEVLTNTMPTELSTSAPMVTVWDDPDDQIVEWEDDVTNTNEASKVKPTEPKPTTPKATEPTPTTKPTTPKATEPTPTTKPTTPKATEPTPTTKPTTPKATEPTPTTKPTEPKATEPTPTTKPTEPKPTQPTPTTPKPTQLTYAQYSAMSSAQKQAYFESFASMDAFLDWYDAALAEYEANKDVTNLGGGSVDLGDLIGK